MKRWNEGHRGSRVGSVSWALAFGALTSFGCSGADDGEPDPTPLSPIAGTDAGGSSGNGGAAGGATPALAGTSSGGTAGALPTTAQSGQAGDAASERGGAGGAGTGGSMGSESGAGSPEDGGRGGRFSGRGGREGRGGTSSGGAPATAGTSGSTSAGTAGTSAMGGPTDGELAGILEAHNEVRAMVMEGDPLPPLTWSEEIAEFAQEWADTLANQCGTLQHRMPNRYGENLALRGYGGNISLPPYGPEAVDAWAGEIECWTFGTINGTEKCDAQCIEAQHSNGCGHYTQLVWRKSKTVGCGYSTCKNGNTTVEIVVCNYDPPGNYVGQVPY